MQEIRTNDLIAISNKLALDHFFPINIHRLAALSLLTVKEYSDSKRRLKSQDKIDLSIAYMPELLKHFLRNNKVDQNIFDEIAKILSEEPDRIRSILEGQFLCASSGRTRYIQNSPKKKCCF